MFVPKFLVVLLALLLGSVIAAPAYYERSDVASQHSLIKRALPHRSQHKAATGILQLARPVMGAQVR
ncbi:hypothetical protein BJ912DRAFT_1057766 [Pholiota molesta]|nr:hypothetical protein BJ912DRAFT_1057766 [Pholiota molesta]